MGRFLWLLCLWTTLCCLMIANGNGRVSGQLAGSMNGNLDKGQQDETSAAAVSDPHPAVGADSEEEPVDDVDGDESSPTEETPSSSTDSAEAASSSGSNLLGLGGVIGELKDTFTVKGQPPKHSNSSKDDDDKKEDKHDHGHGTTVIKEVSADDDHEKKSSSSSDSSKDAEKPAETVIEKEVETKPKNAGTGVTGNAAGGASSNNGNSRTGTGLGFDQVLGDNNSIKLTDGQLVPKQDLLRRSRQQSTKRHRQAKRVH